jgi:iron complex outermembrane receptor protein
MGRAAALRRVSPAWALLALAAALAPCANVYAQGPARSLTGLVLSGADSTPVVGAFVEIAGTTLRTATDAAGQFAFTRTPPGRLELRIARIGFRPVAVRWRSDSAVTPGITVVLVPAPIEVSPVIVTASRETHLAEDAPTSVSVATSQDIEHRATIGVDEAVALVPGVQILDGQINIRGSSGYAKGLGSRVLLLIDGVPANQGDRGGINWDLLPVTEVERVEVLKGTGSALYGSAALGGVVNVITREIPDAPQFSARLFSGAYQGPAPLWRWRSGDALFGGADLGLSRRLGPLRLLVSGGAVDNQGYRENNSDRRSHALAKVVFEQGPALQAELYASAVHENVGNVVFWCQQGQCVDRGLASQPFRVDSTTLGDRLLSDKYQVQATARRILGPVLALNARVSWFRTSFQDRFRADSNGSTADRFGAELGAEWHPSAGHVIHAGTEETYSTVTSDLFGDHSQTELAWFAETETQVADSVRMSVGARLDAIAVDAVGWSAVGSPRFAVTWQLPAVRLRASVGRGFRAPSLAERFTSTAEQGIRVIPNPNLGNETSWAGEVGATTRLGARFELDGALFWNEYQNLIEPGLVSGGTQIQFANVTHARVRGLDLTARAAALANGHLSGELAYTFLDARDLTLDEPLAFRPKHLATLSADWVLGRRDGHGSTLAAGFDAHLASSPQRVEIFESDRRVPARTLDLRATWRRGGLEVIGKVENVFNYIYTLVPRTLEPPRTYSLSLATTW